MKKLVLLLSLAGSLLAFCWQPAMPTQQPLPLPKHPNILWLSVEDISSHLSSYADQEMVMNFVSTPNLDRLAGEGIRFINAFCTAGVCAPSRNAIITGRYQTSNGGHNMRTGGGIPKETGLPTQYSAVMPPSVRAFPEYMRVAGYYTTNNEKTDYQFEAPPTVWDETSKTTTYLNRTDKQQPNVTQPKAAQPFFAIFNNTGTHESKVWANANRPLRVDPDTLKIPPYYPDTKTVRQDLARFLTNISEMDDWVGEKMKELEASGQADNTIVFFWSDHGDGLPFVKREIYDRGLRVPLIVRFPDKRQAGTTRADLVSMIDLAPTVLSLAGIPTPKQMHGQAFLGQYAAKQPRQYAFAARDRIDSEYDRVRTVLDGRYQYVRNFQPEKPLYMDIAYRKQQPMMVEMLQLRDAGKLNTTQMNWFRQTKPNEEFYDLKTDPFQLINVIGKPKYAAQVKRLRQEFDRWQREVPDLGAIPEKELVSRWWNGADAPPVTQMPLVKLQNGKTLLSCPTEGASIGYKYHQNDTWQVYTQPFVVRPGDSLYVVAQRIGYEPTRIVKNGDLPRK